MQSSQPQPIPSNQTVTRKKLDMIAGDQDANNRPKIIRDAHQETKQISLTWPRAQLYGTTMPVVKIQ